MPTSETIAICKTELLQKKEHLQGYLDYDLIPIEELPRDREEGNQAVDERIKANLNNIASKSMLADVAAAIERLAESTFGTCIDCKNDVGDDRLRAMPWVSRCKPCQEKKGIKVH